MYVVGGGRRMSSTRNCAPLWRNRLIAIWPRARPPMRRGGYKANVLRRALSSLAM